MLPLNAAKLGAKRNLGLYDVVYVHVIEGKTVAKPKNAGGGPGAHRHGRRARRNCGCGRPVQGAALVLENKTGRILAMAGSFSYSASQLNRTSQTQRQPGSAMKPLTYLTALQAGLQPNTLVSDDPITLAPIGASTASSRASTTARCARNITGRRATPTAAWAACSPCGADWRIQSTS